MKKIVPKDAVLIPDGATKAFKGQIYDTYQWPQKMFDGSIETFEMLKRADTVTVIPVVDEQILVIEDEQPHSGARLGFPGGRVDDSDPTTLEAAKREVAEEVGYQFDDWRLIKVWQPHTKIEWFIYFYVASSGHKTGEPHLDAGERITPRKYSFAEAKKMVVTKSGYLGESKEIFEQADSLDQLLALEQFSGTEVDR